MNSNITLKSNIYINKTCKRDDQDFIYHILDFRVLKRYAGDSIPKTSTQKMILEQGAPMSMELCRGECQWGVNDLFAAAKSMAAQCMPHAKIFRTMSE